MHCIRAIAIALALALPAAAQDLSEAAPTNRPWGDSLRVGAPRHGGPGPAVAIGEGDPVQAFVEANVVETLYHELAHVLIDQLDLAVFGPEEFAADMFSVVLLNRMFGEAEAVRMGYDIAASYDANAREQAQSGIGPAMWDVHGLDRQRYYTFVCLMFGANPNERAMMAHRLRLPDARSASCEDEYALTARAWGAVLDRLAAGAPGTTLGPGIVTDPDSHLARFVTAEIDRLNRAMALPRAVPVHVVPCSEVNAFYDPESGEMLICTELARHLATIAR